MLATPVFHFHVEHRDFAAKANDTNGRVLLTGKTADHIELQFSETLILCLLQKSSLHGLDAGRPKHLTFVRRVKQGDLQQIELSVLESEGHTDISIGVWHGDVDVVPEKAFYPGKRLRFCSV